MFGTPLVSSEAVDLKVGRLFLSAYKHPLGPLYPLTETVLKYRVVLP